MDDIDMACMDKCAEVIVGYGYENEVSLPMTVGMLSDSIRKYKRMKLNEGFIEEMTALLEFFNRVIFERVKHDILMMRR